MTQPEKSQISAGGVAKGAAVGSLKTVAFIVNFFLPGVGTLLLGKIGTGIIQICAMIVGFIGILFGGIGLLIIFAVWVWGLVTVVNFGKKQQQVVIVQQQPPQTPPSLDN